MKKLILLLVILLIGFSSVTFAGDVWVNGYFRRDGTYVQGHWRSAPNQYRWDNYGRNSGSNSYYSPYNNPYTRDYDGDGIYNQYDMDDDNDGKLDQYDND